MVYAYGVKYMAGFVHLFAIYFIPWLKWLVNRTVWPHWNAWTWMFNTCRSVMWQYIHAGNRQLLWNAHYNDSFRISALGREGEQVARKTFDNALIIFYNKLPPLTPLPKRKKMEKNLISNFVDMFSRYIIRHIVGISLIHFRLFCAHSFAIH